MPAAVAAASSQLLPCFVCDRTFKQEVKRREHHINEHGIRHVNSNASGGGNSNLLDTVVVVNDDKETVVDDNPEENVVDIGHPLVHLDHVMADGDDDQEEGASQILVVIEND